MKIVRYPRHCLQIKRGTASECLPIHKCVAKFNFNDFVICEMLLCTIRIVLWLVITRSVQEIPLGCWRQDVSPKHCYVFTKLHNNRFIKLTAAMKSDFREVPNLRNSFPSAHSQKILTFDLFHNIAFLIFCASFGPLTTCGLQVGTSTMKAISAFIDRAKRYWLYTDTQGCCLSGGNTYLSDVLEGHTASFHTETWTER